MQQLELGIDRNDRVSAPAVDSLNYGFRCFPNAVRLGRGGVSISKVLKDCRNAFNARASGGEDYSAGVTFWIAADSKPRCLLEHLALEIFRLHTKNCKPGTIDFGRSGAEWWTLDVENDDDVAFHWDKDYSLEDHGISLHPHVATVTYFSDVGAPTCIMNHKGPLNYAAPFSGECDKAWLSYPVVAKHVSFDGQFLHAAPADLADCRPRKRSLVGKRKRKPNKVASEVDGKGKRRTSFLVNIWLHWKPCDSTLLPKRLLKSMSGVPSENVFAPSEARVTTVRALRKPPGRLRRRHLKWDFSMGSPATVCMPDPKPELENVDVDNAGHSYELVFDENIRVDMSSDTVR